MDISQTECLGGIWVLFYLQRGIINGFEAGFNMILFKILRTHWLLSGEWTWHW